MKKLLVICILSVLSISACTNKVDNNKESEQFKDNWVKLEVETEEHKESEETTSIVYDEQWEAELEALVELDKTYKEKETEIIADDIYVPTHMEFPEVTNNEELIGVNEDTLNIIKTTEGKEELNKLANYIGQPECEIFHSVYDEYNQGYLMNTYYITFNYIDVYYLFEYPEKGIVYVLKNDSYTYEEIVKSLNKAE